MNIPIEKKKTEAVKRMKLLKLLPNVIKEFEDENTLYYSEIMGILYWVSNKPEWETYIANFEKKHGVLVYHAEFSRTEFGDCLSLLYVSDHEEEWENDIKALKERCPFTYVWNITASDCSEFGRIGIKPMNGGIKRTA